ncbi:MAG: Rieske Fe-S protein [Myxococcota bacterium]
MTDDKRRDFLKTSASTLGVVAVAGTSGGCALFHKQDEDLEIPKAARQFTIDLEKFPQLKEAGGLVRVEAKDGDARMMVLRRPDKSLVALSMECTHVGCDLDFVKAKRQFECPCHGSRFDLNGTVLEGPAEDPLPRYTVEETATGIQVTL